MKKILLSLAFVTAGLFAFNMSAQQQECTNTSNTKECCAAHAKKGPKVGMANPFGGIELTAEQQTAVKALNEKFSAKMKDGKKEKEEGKNVERKDRRETKKAYLKELQQILTPEQYTTYLENQVLNARVGKEARKSHNKKAHARVKDKKGMKKRATAKKLATEKKDA